MAGKEQVREQINALRSSLGKAALHTLFPNDFEYYMIALELVDSKGYTIDYLSFPVNPRSLRQSDVQLTNIKQSLGGVTVIKSPTFVPKDIKISGDFGRNFKVLIQPFSKDTFKAFGGGMSVKDGVWKKTDNPSKNKLGALVKKIGLNAQIKTGYGATKLLQAICDKSGGVDLDGNPVRLYLYNMALGESYLVEVISADFEQSYPTSNMLWNYDLTLKAVAPITGTKKGSKKSQFAKMAFSALAKGATELARGASEEIRKTVKGKTDDVFESVGRTDSDVGKSAKRKITR